MYCRDCGNEIDDNAVVCPKCGRAIKNKPSSYYENPGAGAGWGILAFFIPIVGLILAVVNFNKRRNVALASCKGVLVRTCVSIVFSIIYGIITIVSVITGSSLLPSIPSIGGTTPPGNETTTPSVTGPGWNNFPTDNPTANTFVYPSPPEPLQAVYNNSDDGVLTFSMTEENWYTVYDCSTDMIVAYDQYNIRVYERASGNMRHEETYSMPIACAAAYGGRLAIGFGDSRNMVILNLTTFSSKTYPTTIAVFDIDLTNYAVLYVDNDQWCTVKMMWFNNETESVVIDGIYRPHIAVNQEKGILYAAETGLSSCDLIYVNLATFEASTKTEFSQYSYSYYDVVYDGTYLHAMGNLYDPIKGNIVSAGQYLVKNQEGWRPYSTLCTDGKYSLTITTDCKTAVYNSESKKIEYTMDLYATRIYAIGDNQYVALCGYSGYYALIDLNKM